MSSIRKIFLWCVLDESQLCGTQDVMKLDKTPSEAIVHFQAVLKLLPGTWLVGKQFAFPILPTVVTNCMTIKESQRGHHRDSGAKPSFHRQERTLRAAATQK